MSTVPELLTLSCVSVYEMKGGTPAPVCLSQLGADGNNLKEERTKGGKTRPVINVPQAVATLCRDGGRGGGRAEGRKAPLLPFRKVLISFKSHFRRRH